MPLAGTTRAKPSQSADEISDQISPRAYELTKRPNMRRRSEPLRPGDGTPAGQSAARGLTRWSPSVRRPGVGARLFVLVLGAVGGSGSGSGSGPPAAHAAGFDLDFFKPTTPSTGTFSEENGMTVGAGRLDLATTAGYSHRPLIVVDQSSGATLGYVVSDRLTSFATAAFGINDMADVGLRFTTVLRQQGNVDADIAADAGVPQRPGSPALGDVDVLARIALVQRDRRNGRFRLTLLASIGIPTGAPDALAGAGHVSLRPRVVAGWHGQRLSAAGSVGFVYTPAVEVPLSSLVVGKAALAGLSMAYAVVPARLWMQAEASFMFGVDLSATGIGTAASQVMVGPRVFLPWKFLLQAGVGTGLTRAAGSPRLSGLLTLGRVLSFP